MAVQMPTPHVRRRQSLHESTQVAILQRPQDQVPVVWHQAVTEDSEGNLNLRLRQHLFKAAKSACLSKI